jgi:glutathione S-transferase
MSVVILHQWERSPFCRKVRKVLRHKGIDFTALNYNGLLGRQAARLTPAGQLPVLDFDGKRVQDSSEIVAFLEARVPTPSLVPADSRQRALAWLLEDWADESLYWHLLAVLLKTDPRAMAEHIAVLCDGRPAWERIPVRLVVNRMYRRKLAGQGLGRLPTAVVQARLSAQLDLLEALLASGPWLVGESKSIADIAVSAQLDGLSGNSSGASRIRQNPSLAEWLSRCA